MADFDATRACMAKADVEDHIGRRDDRPLPDIVASVLADATAYLENRRLPLPRQHLLAVALVEKDAECERLRAALEKIVAIEHKMVGPDWEEIEEAQKIARAALGAARKP